MAASRRHSALVAVVLLVLGCSHAATASTKTVNAPEISNAAPAATPSTPSDPARTQPAAAAVEQAALINGPSVQQQMQRQPVVQQRLARQLIVQQQVLQQPVAVFQRPAGAPAARSAVAHLPLVPARHQQQQQQQQRVTVQQPAGQQQQQQVVTQHPAAAGRPATQQPGRQQQPVAAARRVPVQQPRIVYVPVPVPVAAQPAAPAAPQESKRPQRSSGGLGKLPDLDFGLLPKLNLTSGLETFRSGLSGLLTDFQKNGGFWNAASRSENIANAVQLGVKGGLNLVAPIVNGIASSVPIMVPSLNGQCLQGKAVRPMKSNRKLIMCLVGTGAQVTDYILNAADSLAGMAGEVLDPEAAAALQNSTTGSSEAAATPAAAAGDASAVAEQPEAAPEPVPAVPAVPVEAPTALQGDAAPAAAVPAASTAPVSSIPAPLP